MQILDEAQAIVFARIALGHVTREYPHKLDHVVDVGDALATPRQLHPVFFGSFDWHSCVHGYWLLARVLRRFPAMAPAAEIRALFDAQVTPAKIAVEAAYLDRPSSRGFERPYGWAWLLKLAAELAVADEAAWSAALAPLVTRVVTNFRAFLPLATDPGRVGAHPNTAFALCLAADYADVSGDGALQTVLRDKALAWYGNDAACPAWEPDGDDFLSPALVEALCMKRLLPPAQFGAWFERFLPHVAEAEPKTLFRPVTPTDRSDGKLAHLDGLNLSRAWCWRALAAAFPDHDPRRAVALAAASTHLTAGLPHVGGDYMGAHWLASFALLALDDGSTGDHPGVGERRRTD